MMLFVATIPGRPIVKKNTQRVVGRGKSKRAIYSPQFIAWERVALAVIRGLWQGAQPICEPIRAKFTFHFINRQAEPDVSNLIEGVQDALTKAGVIADDRLIKIVTAEKCFGEVSEPATLVEIHSLEVSNAS